MIRALQRHGAPCVLAHDHVERLQSPEAVAAQRLPDRLRILTVYGIVEDGIGQQAVQHGESPRRSAGSRRRPNRPERRSRAAVSLAGGGDGWAPVRH